MAELNGAWDILRERLEKGHKFVKKYYDEFKEERYIQSPASTLSEVYAPFLPDASVEQRIREYKALVPTHQREGLPPAEVLDLSRPLEEIVTVPPHLLAAYPYRAPETDPKALSYNAMGQPDDVSYLKNSTYGPGPAVRQQDPPESISTGLMNMRKNRSRQKDKVVSFINPQATAPAAYDVREGESPFDKADWSQLYLSTA